MTALLGAISIPIIVTVVVVIYSCYEDSKSSKYSELGDTMHCNSCFYWNFHKQCCDLSADNRPSTCNRYEDYYDDFYNEDGQQPHG